MDCGAWKVKPVNWVPSGCLGLQLASAPARMPSPTLLMFSPHKIQQRVQRMFLTATLFTAQKIRSVCSLHLKQENELNQPKLLLQSELKDENKSAFAHCFLLGASKPCLLADGISAGTACSLQGKKGLKLTFKKPLAGTRVLIQCQTLQNTQQPSFSPLDGAEPQLPEVSRQFLATITPCRGLWEL